MKRLSGRSGKTPGANTMTCPVFRLIPSRNRVQPESGLGLHISFTSISVGSFWSSLLGTASLLYKCLHVHWINVHTLDVVVHWSGLADDMESLNTISLTLSWVSAHESFSCHCSERPNDTMLRAPPKFDSPPATPILRKAELAKGATIV